MKRWPVVLLVICALGLANGAGSAQTTPKAYLEALDLIHAFSGAGDELDRAIQLAKGLERTNPKSGYAQTLYAELLSTWELDQDGEPESLQADIIKLTDDALRLNPRLAQAYVARARVLLRASKYDEAAKAIDAGLAIDPNLSGGLFIRAEISRRTGKVAEAESAYLKFIDTTPSRTRRSNGYYWLAVTYEKAIESQPEKRSALLAKARGAYEKMLELDPEGAWKNVNFAIFLNNEVGDFAAAEQYARKALSIMEFPMARYHWAIARYQKLLRLMDRMDQKKLKAAVERVQTVTNVPLADAVSFSRTWPKIQARLLTIQARLQPGIDSMRSLSEPHQPLTTFLTPDPVREASASRII